MDFERGLGGAAQRGDVARVRFLLSRGACADGCLPRGTDGGDTGSAPPNGHTPLIYAARAGHVEVCDLLLKHGASVGARTRAGAATALHRAAGAGHEQVVQLLLAHGADVAAVDSDGLTAADKARCQNHENIVALISPHQLKP
ncbi:hypothetical protein CLOM_g12921 [Closterium sp. NIES-68]|nr:hypothetical protein CLOM_g12921 [Closterium sp. NIES-68]GJP61552.1 hypothetical protein CLOP_g18697 [Closterium sp. NIES-67]GJP83186.1 hypothetical protein CLOP_g13374 [Closterium sp. NIES-67]